MAQGFKAMGIECPTNRRGKSSSGVYKGLMKKIEIKIAPRKIIIYSYFLIAIITAVTILYTSLFLYKNFYQTITQSEEIIALRAVVAVESIDIKKFDRIIKKIENKTVARPSLKINNPFD